MKKNPVVHFEMPAKDKKRVSIFYSAVFGWKMDQMGAEFGEYIVATTTQSDKKTGRPKEPGAINGGFYEYKDEPVYEGRQDLGPVKTVCLLLRDGPKRQEYREIAHAERKEVGQHVAGIGNERKAVRQDAADELYHHACPCQDNGHSQAR